MNAPDLLSKADQLRLRDGDRCWLCNGKLDFQAVPNSNKAPTIEHLVALASRGSKALENLVLTHPGCSKQLGARPLEEKRSLRAKYRTAREWTHAAREVRAATPIEEGGRKDADRPVPTERLRRPAAPRRALRWWQAGAALAVGTAVFAMGFAAGLLAAH